MKKPWKKLQLNALGAVRHQTIYEHFTREKKNVCSDCHGSACVITRVDTLSHSQGAVGPAIPDIGLGS